MGKYEPLSSRVESLAKTTVDSAFKVHKALGPGLLESVYDICLVYELRQRGLIVNTQVPLPVVFEGVTLEAGLRLDMLVENELIVELKAVEKINPVFEAQLLTYLKLSRHRLGLLINFNVPLIRDGIKRVILWIFPLSLRAFVVN